MSASFRSLGQQTLKNITDSVEVLALDSGTIAALPAPEPRARLMPVRLDWRWAAASAGVLVAVAVIAGLLRMTPAAAPDKSVAVLPFVNLSEDQANAYFADGMQDEILTALAKIRDLKVISRTSVERYRNTRPALRAIASALGVATVVEGGVLRAGNRVRINVQLIDANTDQHLWADSYDRELSDVFAVQSEVARKVVEALRASLLPAEALALAAVPTQNTQAYDLYLQGSALFRSAYDGSDGALAGLAIALYERALTADPAFALAAVGLARAHLWVYWFSEDQTPARLALVKAAVDRALAQQPDLPEAHAVLGVYYYWGHRDYAAALVELERAQKSLPNDAFVAALTAAVTRRQGLWDRTLDGWIHATNLNPLDVNAWANLGITYCALRRYSECETSVARASALVPDSFWATSKALARVYGQGDLGPLRAVLGTLTTPKRLEAYAAYQLGGWSREFDTALQALAASPDDWISMSVYFEGPKSLLVARLYGLKGDAPRAEAAYTGARRELEAALKSRPEAARLLIGLGLAYSGLGEHELAVTTGQRAVDLLPMSTDAVIGADLLNGLAEIHVAAGNYDQALTILKQLAALPTGWVVSPALLKLDPAWDPVRQDARFQKMLAEPW